MPLVIIQAATLSSDQKKRIGDRVVECLHQEGIHASSVVVLFQPDKSDVYLDGGLVHEIADPGMPTPREPEPRATPAPSQEPVRGRRSRSDFTDLRDRVEELLRDRGELSSFDAQEALGLRDVDGTPAALRRVFGELEADGLILKQGQKRGTRYVWQGVLARPAGATPILVKRAPADDEAAMPEMPMED